MSGVSMESTSPDARLLKQLVSIVSAYVSYNATSAPNLIALIASTYAALASLREAHGDGVIEAPTPAVPIQQALTPEYIVCLEDGKKFRSMKLHLSGLGMTPKEYRAKWGLPSDYPMTAPTFAAKLSALAKAEGLRRKAARER